MPRTFRWIPTLLLTACAAVGQSERAADVTQLYRQIMDTHPAPFRETSAEAWAEAYNTLRAEAPRLGEDAFMVRLSRFAALARDGHTNLVPFYLPPESFRARLPLRFYVFAEGVFVTEAGEDHAHVTGARLVSVNGHAIDTVLDSLSGLVGGDNSQWPRRWAAVMLTHPNYLEGLGFGGGDRSGPWMLAFETDAGRTDVTVTPGAQPDRWVEARTRPEPLVPADLAYGFVHLPADRAVYAAYRQVADAGEETVAEFANRLFSFVETNTGVDRLILDIRENGGGNNYLNQPILHGMIRSRLDRPGGIYVLTGRATFSAAMNLATRIERHTQALFVGEPTGGSPNHYGDPQLDTLSVTGLPYLASTLFWQDSQPNDERVWILPDVPVPERFADWRAGRDGALEAALSHTVDPDVPVTPPNARWRRASQQGSWPPSG